MSIKQLSKAELALLCINTFNIFYSSIYTLWVIVLLFTGDISLISNVRNWFGIEFAVGNFDAVWFALLGNIFMIFIFVKMFVEVKNLNYRRSNGLWLFNQEPGVYTYILISLLIFVLMVKSLFSIFNYGVILK